MTSFDLILKGGQVLDPSQNIQKDLDIGISKGKIASLELSIPSDQGRETIDLSGRLVTPGLIDIHTHVFWGANDISIDVDTVCLPKGVTTVVDAGTSGAVNFPAFRRYIIEKAKTRIICFLNINPLGLGETFPRRPIYNLGFADVAKPIDVIDKNSDVILGVKVLMSNPYTGSQGMAPFWLSRFVADKTRTHIMVHFGNSEFPVSDFLSNMRAGDILTHCFNGYVNGILDWDGNIYKEVFDAIRRGVILDVGFGSGSFDVRVAKSAIEQGLKPIISTDLHNLNTDGPVYDLPTTMSKILALGMSLPDVISGATWEAAKALGWEDRIGSLMVGRLADIAVFEVFSGSYEFLDSHKTKFYGNARIIPKLTIRGGVVVSGR